MRLIDISTPKYPDSWVKVDDEDYDYINQWKWFRDSVGYATRCFCTDGKHKQVRMHKFITGTDSKTIIDHANGDALDNRRCNLRECSQRENLQNRKPKHNGHSKYKGVSYHMNTKKWYSKITVFGDVIKLYYGDSEIDAAKAYDMAAIEHFGEFAKTNGFF
jgi:hypothetical protein